MANIAFDCNAAINSVIPRPTPLPGDGVGLEHFASVFLDKDVEAVRRVAPCVVVWCPGTAETDFPGLDPLWRAIRELYRPEAKFGTLEIWRRDR